MNIDLSQLITAADKARANYLATVPQVISKYQGIAQLHNAGLLPSVKAIMADEATDALIVIAWDSVQEFRRESPMIAAIAGALGITDEQLDQMFIDAAKLIA